MEAALTEDEVSCCHSMRCRRRRVYLLCRIWRKNERGLRASGAQTATFLFFGQGSVPLGPMHWHLVTAALSAHHFASFVPPRYISPCISSCLSITYQTLSKSIPTQLGAALFILRFELFRVASVPFHHFCNCPSRSPSGTARRTIRPNVRRSSIPPVVAVEMPPQGPSRPRPMRCPIVSGCPPLDMCWLLI